MAGVIGAYHLGSQKKKSYSSISDKKLKYADSTG